MRRNNIGSIFELSSFLCLNDSFIGIKWLTESRIIPLKNEMSCSSKPLQNTVFDVFPELSTVDV